MFPYIIGLEVIVILNERCYQVLNKILNSHQYLKIEDLSRSFGVSARTIRYDLDRIDDYLEENGLKKLQRKPNEGISYDISGLEREMLQKNLAGIGTYQYVLSQQERILHIFYILLGTKEYCTLQKLADILNVSKATAQNDIKLLKMYINTKTEYIETVKGKGIRIVGDETALRKNASNKLLAYFSADLPATELFRLFNDISIARIQDFVRTAEKQLHTNFSDDKFNNLVIHLIIAIKRIKTGKDIIMERTELNHLSNTPEFAVAASIVNSLEKEFKISIPKSEIGYITIHLLGNTLFNEGIERNLFLQRIVFLLIEKVSALYEFNFEYDDTLYENLAQHIQTFMYRIEHNITVNNPLLSDIKKKYPILFDCVKKAVVFLSKEWQIQINDEECGYVCIHFMTSYERVKHRQEHKPRVLLVCATGIGTSKYILTKLQSIFDFEVKGTASLHNAYNDIANKELDLVISTIPLKPVAVKCILIQPFLTEQNINELSMFFARYNYKQQIDIPDKIRMNKSLRERYNNQLENPSLIELLDYDRIIVGADIENWQQAVEIGGNMLLKDGCITKKYIFNMIDNINNLGNYMILAPNVAMPHAQMDENVKQTAFSLVIGKNPVPFGKDEDFVQIFVILAATDKEKHTRALKELMFLLESETGITALLNAATKEDIINILENISLIN